MNITTNATNVKSVDDYKKRADEIIQKMLDLLMRTQRKIDDVKYRELLQKMQNKKTIT